MTKEFIEQQKCSLVEEKEKIEKELKNIAQKNNFAANDYDATFPDYGRNEEDNVLEEEEYSARVGVEESLEKKLREIGAALKKIEQGDYGTCEKCGKEISVERMKAIPSAAKCAEHMNVF